MLQNRPELSLDEILNIAEKLPWYSVIALSGGEPLCREDFLRVVEGIAALKKKTALLTNGLLLNDDIIPGLIKNRLLNIGIAIEGDKEYYEKIKGQGNYSVLMNNLERLDYYKKKMKSSFPAFDWKVTIFPDNVAQLPRLFKQAAEYGAETFTVSLPKKNNFQFSDCLYGLEIIDGVPASSNIFCYPDNTSEIYKELFALNKRAPTMLRMYPHLKKMEDIGNYFNHSDIRKKYSLCREPWTGMVISAIGEIYPCLSIRIGDMKKQSLSQILMSRENVQFRKQLKKRHIFSVCDGCCYANLRPAQKKGNSGNA